jgi:hypothetical protein
MALVTRERRGQEDVDESLASSSGCMRAPMEITLASLCWRASWAVSSLQASAARTPVTSLAAICSPLPEPPSTTP